MNLIQRNAQNAPVGLHGNLLLPDGADISTTIEDGIKKLLPSNMRPAINNVFYMLHTNEDGTTSVIFEIDGN